jgi:hypothetical protein
MARLAPHKDAPLRPLIADAQPVLACAPLLVRVEIDQIRAVTLTGVHDPQTCIAGRVHQAGHGCNRRTQVRNILAQLINPSARRTEIPLTNYRGIELRDFPAEIARLALIIAEYQCDVTYRGQKEALAEFLPLDAMNWITCGNALRLDWLSICPPTGTGVKHHADDLFMSPLDQAQIDFENEGGETYICGNPPYLGSQWQSTEQKEDLQRIFEGRTKNWKSLDYVSGWFMKAADFGVHTKSVAALVSTNSICQGRQVETLWKLIFETGHEIPFAHTSFKWANLASHNAGVTVIIVGVANDAKAARRLFSLDSNGETVVKETDNINPYLISGPNVLVQPIFNEQQIFVCLSKNV